MSRFQTTGMCQLTQNKNVMCVFMKINIELIHLPQIDVATGFYRLVLLANEDCTIVHI